MNALKRAFRNSSSRQICLEIARIVQDKSIMGIIKFKLM
jgi:hypothetical protein